MIQSSTVSVYFSNNLMLTWITYIFVIYILGIDRIISNNIIHLLTFKFFSLNIGEKKLVSFMLKLDASLDKVKEL